MEGFKSFLNAMKIFFESGLGNLVLFLSVAILGLIFIKIVLKLLSKVGNKSKIEGTVFKFAYAVSKFVLYMLYILTLLTIVGVPITTIVAMITALTLGITLALQSSVSNIANGIVIMANKPFVLGDMIEINGKEGKVTDITMFHTKILTITNEMISIPHNITVNTIVKDFSSMDTRRIDIPVTIDFNSNVAKAKAMLEDIIASNELIIKDAENAVNMSDVNERSVTLVVKAWSTNADFWDCTYALNESVYKLFSEDDIDMPYKKMQIDIASNNTPDIK